MNVALENPFTPAWSEGGPKATAPPKARPSMRSWASGTSQVPAERTTSYAGLDKTSAASSLLTERTHAVPQDPLSVLVVRSKRGQSIAS